MVRGVTAYIRALVLHLLHGSASALWASGYLKRAITRADEIAAARFVQAVDHPEKLRRRRQHEYHPNSQPNTCAIVTSSVPVGKGSDLSFYAETGCPISPEAVNYHLNTHFGRRNNRT